MQFRPPSQPGWDQSDPNQQPFPPQQPSYTEPGQYQQPKFYQQIQQPLLQQQQQWQRPPMMPMQPQKSPKKSMNKKVGIGCGVVAIVLVLIIAISVTAQGNSNSSPSATDSTTPAAQTTNAPMQVVHYPPTTQADLRGLAAQGNASAIHEFHSESVGLVGVCPQPKRLVIVDPSITGQQLAEDLLAYFYGQQLDSPCGSVVFAYHTQAEAAGDGYTAGRILFDANDSSGQGNLNPNATNLTYTLTLDTGDVSTGQEYAVTY